jgi:hypothetical protein
VEEDTYAYMHAYIHICIYIHTYMHTHSAQRHTHAIIYW